MLTDEIIQRKKIDVIMPTWENEEMAATAKQSLVETTRHELRFYKFNDTLINKGWIGYCNEGIRSSLENNDSDYILLVNDDIIMTGMTDWADKMIELMQQLKIGSVSCLTNNAAGWGVVQNFPAAYYKLEYLRVPWLSHFFVLLKKEMIHKIGVLDESLPGGDDIDYCIRVNDAGYWCVLTPKVFCWHHYAKTGKRLFGSYWDSEEYTDKINQAIIKKHGFKKYIYTMTATELKE